MQKWRSGRHPELVEDVVPERRRLVERTVDRLSHWGGLLREDAGRRDAAAGHLARVASLEQALRPAATV